MANKPVRVKVPAPEKHTIPEAAAIIGCAPTSLYRYVRLGKITVAHEDVGGRRRTYVTTPRAWLEKITIKPRTVEPRLKLGPLPTRDLWTPVQLAKAVGVRVGRVVHWAETTKTKVRRLNKFEFFVEQAQAEQFQKWALAEVEARHAGAHAPELPFEPTVRSNGATLDQRLARIEHALTTIAAQLQRYVALQEEAERQQPASAPS